MTVSIMNLIVTHIINDSQHNDTQHKVGLLLCCVLLCRVLHFFIVMLNDVFLRVVVTITNLNKVDENFQNFIFLNDLFSIKILKIFLRHIQQE